MSTSEAIDLSSATKAEMVAFAEEHDIDLGDASTKDEIASVIAESEETVPDDGSEEEGDGAEGDAPAEPAPGGDTDVAALSDEVNEGEYPPGLYPEDWVKLDGSHEDVPDELDGEIASVVEAVNVPAPDAKGTHAALTIDTEEPVLVKVRSQGQLLSLPFDAFSEVGRGGRNALLPFA